MKYVFSDEIDVKLKYTCGHEYQGKLSGADIRCPQCGEGWIDFLASLIENHLGKKGTIG